MHQGHRHTSLKQQAPHAEAYLATSVEERRRGETKKNNNKNHMISAFLGFPYSHFSGLLPRCSHNGHFFVLGWKTSAAALVPPLKNNEESRR